jgi:hypothetical protein
LSPRQVKISNQLVRLSFVHFLYETGKFRVGTMVSILFLYLYTTIIYRTVKIIKIIVIQRIPIKFLVSLVSWNQTNFQFYWVNYVRVNMGSSIRRWLFCLALTEPNKVLMSSPLDSPGKIFDGVSSITERTLRVRSYIPQSTTNYLFSKFQIKNCTNMMLLIIYQLVTLFLLSIK